MPVDRRQRVPARERELKVRKVIVAPEELVADQHRRHAEYALAYGLGRLRVAINWNGKFPAKHFQPANVIAMLVSKKQSIELLGGNATLLKPDYDLARAQSAIDQNVAMTGGNESAIPGAAAAEHGQTEHG